MTRRVGKGRFPGLGAEQGFTLLELLVALAVFAVMSVVIHSSLTSMLDTRRHLEESSRRLAELQSFFRVVGRDIEQAAARPVRDGFGETLPALSWVPVPGHLQLTGGGWRNPAGLPRSTLQRVAYRFSDNDLIRDTWGILDRAPDSEPFSRVVLRGVQRFDAVFIGADEQVFTVWPPPDRSGGSPAPDQLPRAVRLSLDVAGWGRLERLFLLGTAG